MAQYTFETLTDFDIANDVLPSGYTKLDYIQNNGNANTYIDTNYVANQNTILRSLVSTNTTGNTSNGYIGTYRYGFSLTSTRFYAYVNTSNYSYSVPIQLNTKQYVEINNTTKDVFLNGNKLGTMATVNYPIGGTYWIGRLNNYNGEYFNGKIYYNEFLENDISVQKLIPCLNSDNEIGMYDVITDTYFPNLGSTPFIAGPESPTYTFQNGDIIIISDESTAYRYNNGELIFYYHIADPLIFRGFTFEETVSKLTFSPLVFRGFSFEESPKIRNVSPLFTAGM